jgi:hypothetical protein
MVTQTRISPLRFQATIEWARRHPDREFRRIISAPDSGAISAWLPQHDEETRAIANYNARVIPSLGTLDDVGFAVIDDKRVVLAVSGDGTSISAHVLEAPEAVRAFREQYIQKWERAETLPDFLRRSSTRQLGQIHIN